MSNPPHQPTDEQRKTVRAMTAYGITQAQVCAIIGISEPTLSLHYRHELDTAVGEANAKVAQSLFHMATKGGNVSAAIFWLKTRARWKEPAVDLHHSGAEGGPVILQIVTGVPRVAEALGYDAADAD